MNDAPPPATPPPQFSLPIRESRNPVPWLFLAVFFALLISGAIASLYTVSPAKSPQWADRVAFETALRLRLSGLEDDTSLRAIVGRLEKRRKLTTLEARAELIGRYELDATVSARAVETLKSSESRRDRLIARVYSLEKLTPEQAGAMTEEIGSANVYTKFVRKHAMDRSGSGAGRAQWRTNQGTVLILGIIVLAALGMTVVSWCSYLWLRLRGQAKPVGHPLGHLTNRAADGGAVRVVLLFAIFALVPSLFGALAPSKGDLSSWTVLFGGATAIALVIAALRIKMGGIRLSFGKFVGNWRSLPWHVEWGVGAYFASIPFIALATFLGNQLQGYFPPPSHPMTGEMLSARSPVEIAALVFMASVLAPICEEIIFRGVLLASLLNLTKSPTVAIVISSLLFAMIHPQGPILWGALATIGAMCALVTLQTGSLMPAIVLHSVNNTVIAIVLLVAR